MALHLEALRQQRLHHVWEEVEVELGFSVRADGLGFRCGLGEEIVVVLVEELGGVLDEFVVIRVEVPGVGDQELQGEAGCGDLVACDPRLEWCVRLAGSEDGDVELGWRRRRQDLVQAGHDSSKESPAGDLPAIGCGTGRLTADAEVAHGELDHSYFPIVHHSARTRSGTTRTIGQCR